MNLYLLVALFISLISFNHIIAIGTRINILEKLEKENLNNLKIAGNLDESETIFNANIEKKNVTDIESELKNQNKGSNVEIETRNKNVQNEDTKFKLKTNVKYIFTELSRDFEDNLQNLESEDEPEIKKFLELIKEKNKKIVTVENKGTNKKQEIKNTNEKFKKSIHDETKKVLSNRSSPVHFQSLYLMTENVNSKLRNNNILDTNHNLDFEIYTLKDISYLDKYELNQEESEGNNTEYNKTFSQLESKVIDAKFPALHENISEKVGNELKINKSIDSFISNTQKEPINMNKQTLIAFPVIIKEILPAFTAGSIEDNENLRVKRDSEDNFDTLKNLFGNSNVLTSVITFEDEKLETEEKYGIFKAHFTATSIALIQNHNSVTFSIQDFNSKQNPKMRGSKTRS